MPSQYLTGADLALYGVPPGTTTTAILRASAMIDTFLRRPSGMTWQPDYLGQPAYMTNAMPSRTLQTSASIAPGVSVAVSLPGTQWDDSILGQTVILDRQTDGPTECCWISAYAPGMVVLNQVTAAHAGPVDLELGLTIWEQIELPTRRSTVMLSQWPISQVISGLGRYGYGRRSAQETGYFDDVNLLAALSTFGGAPIWEAFDIVSSSYNSRTGEYWVPSSLLLSYFTEVKVWYVGGWQQSALPTVIKTACAAIALAIDAAPMGVQARRFNTGKLTIERFTDSVMDHDIKAMLRPYIATTLG